MKQRLVLSLLVLLAAREALAQELRERATLKGHDGAVHFATFSPDGTTLASVGADKVIRLWSVATGKELARLGDGRSPVLRVCFSPDGLTLAAAGEKLQLWDARTGKQKVVLEEHSDVVRSAAFSPAGKTLASADVLGVIRIWDLATGTIMNSILGSSPVGDGTLLAFSPDGRVLATTTSDHQIRFWEMADIDERATFSRAASAITSLTFSPDSKAVAVGDGSGAIRLRQLATGKRWGSDKAHPSGVCLVAFSPGGRFLISGSGVSGKAGTVKVWEAATCTERAAYEIGLNPLAMSPDGKTLAAANVTGTIKLFDLPAAD